MLCTAYELFAIYAMSETNGGSFAICFALLYLGYLSCLYIFLC
jgi:hypothetical protein